MADFADIALSAASLAAIDTIEDDDLTCMDAGEDEWMVVGRKGRGVRRPTTSHADDDELRPSSLQSSVTNDGVGTSCQASHTIATAATTEHHFPTPCGKSVAPSCDALLQLVERAFHDVRSSRFYRNCVSALRSVETALQEQLAPDWSLHNIQSLVVYGLGSLAGYQGSHAWPAHHRHDCTAGINARHQLALAMLLRQTLPGLQSPPEAFDPVFTSVDREVLACVHVDVIAHNERGRRLAKGPTVFYLPHCEAELTDALLEANWRAGQLHNVIIIGACHQSRSRGLSACHHRQQLFQVCRSLVAASRQPQRPLPPQPYAGPVQRARGVPGGGANV